MGGKRANGRKRDARISDTILEVGRQTAVLDLGPAGKSEIATRDVSPNPLLVTIEHEGGWETREGRSEPDGRSLAKRIDARP